MKETSYNKKGTLNISTLGVAYKFRKPPNVLLGGLVYLNSKINTIINRRIIMV